VRVPSKLPEPAPVPTMVCRNFRSGARREVATGRSRTHCRRSRCQEFKGRQTSAPVIQACFSGQQSGSRLIVAII
jgi:hypothetical protein